MTSGKRHGTAKARTDWPKFRNARGFAKKMVRHLGKLARLRGRAREAIQTTKQASEVT